MPDSEFLQDYLVSPFRWLGDNIIAAARVTDDAQQNFFLGVSKKRRRDSRAS